MAERRVRNITGVPGSEIVDTLENNRGRLRGVVVVDDPAVAFGEDRRGRHFVERGADARVLGGGGACRGCERALSNSR